MRYVSRRKFLQGLGVTAALSPFVPLIDARGQTTAYPKRLVLFFTPHATFFPKWTPTGTQTNFTLGPILAPLAQHQSKINVIAGVGMADPEYFVAHTPGGVQIWTGSQLLRGPQNSDGSYQYGANSGPSVDQVVAASVGNTTAYSSLQFSAQTGETVIFSGPGQAVFGASDAQASFNRLFGNVTSGPALANQKSVLDVVTAQLSALRGKVSAADQNKIAAHLAATRDIETRLQVQQANCAGPNLSTDSAETTGFASMIDLASSALACDLTRVVSLQFSQQDNDGSSYPFLGIQAGHHPLTHLAPSDTVDENNNPVTDQTKSVNGQLTSIYTWYASMFARLLDRLDAVPEGSGTMLDNTLVVWGSELSDYNTHAFRPTVPFVTAGGAGGGLKTGRFLDLTGTPQLHNRLLVSICNLMGLTTVHTFGNMDAGTGPLMLL